MKRSRGRPQTPRMELRLEAVVVTVTVDDAGLDPFRLTDVGESEQDASDGAPLHAKLTVPVRPPAGAMVKL